MPANTPLGIPYPVAADRVADGHEQMQALAEATDALLAAATAARTAMETALDARLDAIEADTGWTALPFATAWSNYGGGWATAAYRKVRGIVHLRGLVKKTAGSGTLAIGTLPAGFRPAAPRMFPAVAASYFGMFAYDGGFGKVVYSGAGLGGGGFSGGVESLPTRLDLSAAGVLTASTYTELADAVAWLSLDGISYLAEA